MSGLSVERTAEQEITVTNADGHSARMFVFTEGQIAELREGMRLHREAAQQARLVRVLRWVGVSAALICTALAVWAILS